MLDRLVVMCIVVEVLVYSRLDYTMLDTIGNSLYSIVVKVLSYLKVEFFILEAKPQ